MGYYTLLCVVSAAQAYITCNDYYDIFDVDDPIVCTLISDTPTMRQKFTKLDHEMVITDSTGLQQVYPMPWSNETGQWTLDTSSNMVQCFSEIFLYQFCLTQHSEKPRLKP